MTQSQVNRLNAIKKLIEEKNIDDQISLVELLKTSYGIDSNQTAVSRDLQKLGATKKLVSGKLVYDLPQFDASIEILRLAILSIKHNEAIIVIDTLPGLAGFVGDYLDMQISSEILGTLAGENVVFVTPKSIKKIKNFYIEICKILKYKDQKK
ncbi:MAG: Arginine repressor [Chlamydiia bacterium]|nr:Arginine repressor [Chlamydiia bacterium]